MLYNIDLASLETEVRDLIGEDVAALWDSPKIRRQINHARDELMIHCIDLDQGYFETNYTVTPTSTTIPLPSNFYKLRSLEIYRNGLWQPLRWVPATDKYTLQAPLGIATDAYGIRFEGGNLIIETGLGSVSSIRMHYSYVLPPMISGTASAGAATSITLDSDAAIIDDAYNLSRIFLTGGTGAGQFNTITDYVGSTKEATVSTWVTNPDTDTTYSHVLPDPLDRWPGLVVQNAAMRCLLRRRDPELIAEIEKQYNRGLDRLRTSLRRRQTDQAPRIRFIPDADELFGG